MTVGLNGDIENAGSKRSPSLFHFVDANEMLAKEYPPMQWLVEDLLPKKGLCMIAGTSGVGKTILALNLAVCVARGEDFLGFKVAQKGPVLYIDNELGEEDIWRRLKKMTGSCDAGTIHFAPYAPMVEDVWEEIIEYCLRYKPSLVVIDSLYLAQRGREKEESDMRSFLSRVKDLKQRHDTCVVLVHHFRKGVKNERADLDLISGSGAIGRILDSAVSIRRSDVAQQQRILKILKGRHCKDSFVGKAFELSLRERDLWFVNEREVCEDDHITELQDRSRMREIVRTAILSQPNPKFTRVDALAACTAVRGSRATVDRVLRDLVKSGELIKNGYSAYEKPGNTVEQAPGGLST